MTARTVCRNAWREPALSSEAKPLARIPRSPSGARPTRPSSEPTDAAEPDHPARRQRRQHEVRPRQGSGAQHEVHLAAEPAAGDEHQPFGALGELVGELHRDPAAQGVPDDRDALVAERGDDVARAAGVRSERVVPARRRRLAVAEQVGRDQREVLAEQRGDALPGLRGVGDPVQEQQRRAAAGRPVAHAMSMQVHRVGFKGHPAHQSTRSAPIHGSARTDPDVWRVQPPDRGAPVPALLDDGCVDCHTRRS